MPQIETRDLCKRFRVARHAPGFGGALRQLIAPQYTEKMAVDGLDLAIDAGEAVAYVGPNGAGKSTTIKMLTGILVPTSGDVWVNNIVPHRNRIQNAERIGVVFGHRTQLWWDLPVRESLTLQHRLYGVPEPIYKQNLERLERLLGLGSFLHLTARKLSLGQRMRADLAMALLHDPSIVYLDEPTIGLDVNAKDELRAVLKQLNRERGTTILLTTHDLVDIEQICQRIVILDQGRKIFDGLLTDMKDQYARERAIYFQIEAARPHMIDTLERLHQVSAKLEGDRHLVLRFDRFQHSAGTLTHEVMRHATVIDFRVQEPSIEDVIRQVYRGTLLNPADLTRQKVAATG